MTDRSLKPFITEASARKFARAAGDFLALSPEQSTEFLRKLRNDRVNWSHKEGNAEPVVKLKRKGKTDGKTKEKEVGPTKGLEERSSEGKAQVDASSQGVAADHD